MDPLLRGSKGPDCLWSRSLMRHQTAENLEETNFGGEGVSSVHTTIVLFLQAANEVAKSNPIMANGCRRVAFEVANRLDPTSSGTDVCQLKTALLRHLEIENDRTSVGKKSDVQEMEKFCESYHKILNQALADATCKADRMLLERLQQTGTVLLGTLMALHVKQSLEHEREILDVQDKVAEITNYNILPLGPNSENQAIMRVLEILAAVFVLQNIGGLPWPKYYWKKGERDVLDWLQAVFGFQTDNVANQREHLILLLANVHMRQFPEPEQLKLDERALTDAMEKLVENYTEWCKYLGRKSNILLPIIQLVQQHKLLYMGLYLLIWGEAANLRHMPECLCYIYHHMAFELNGMLAGNVIPLTSENVKPAYGGEKEAFLMKVVTPIYKVIAKEVEKSTKGRSEHSEWRNYDDFNEYFWSVKCFELGWPMRADADFFCSRNEQIEKIGDRKPATGDKWFGKVNFVEIRSFWQIYRSFDRMWSFFILCLQAMIIVAWNGSGQPTAIFDADVFKKVLSVFITAAILKLGQAVLDVILSWKARQSMSLHVKLRYILKVVSAAAWVIVLPVTYAYAWENPPGFVQPIKSWFGNNSNSPSLFILAAIIYLSPNMLATVLFLMPFVRQHLDQHLERSNCKIVKLMMLWSQPQLYVGRGMLEGAVPRFLYTMFWVLLLTTKLAFCYYIEIQPLVGLTKTLMSVQLTNFQWHEFLPGAIDVVIALWAPIILVYFMDTQIWYAIFSTLLGGLYGALCRLGEIQTLGMLRSRFQSLLGAFNDRLIPAENSEPEKKEIEATFSCKFGEISRKGAARFVQFWNNIIASFREEDLISNREVDLLLFPYCADWDLELIQWPLFLLASKIPIALEMAKDSSGKDRELKKRIDNDDYMSCAVRECYASFRDIIKFMVLGVREKNVIDNIFDEVHRHIEAGDLAYRMSALPSLYELFVELIKCLRVNRQNDLQKVVVLFQDMLKVVTRDIMKDQPSSSVDSIHGENDGGTPADISYQLFASSGAIMFPINPVTEDWRKKIERLFLLLTAKESAAEVPSNSEARRRITFFANSLFMNMPSAPKVHNMLSFSVLTPYYNEDVLFSLKNLEEHNEDGVSILFYLQKIHPDEWKNFLERMNCQSREELQESHELEEKLCLWASYRGQTLTRTVRGMMYYRKALELQSFLDMAQDGALMVGYKAVESEDDSEEERSLRAKCQALADIKSTYVVSCQQYGIQKQSDDPRAQNIQRLMIAYPSLRVAYIDEVEVADQDSANKTSEKLYYSCLAKAKLPRSNSSDPVQSLDEVIYKIKLPGPAILGEGKPENQNQAIIFTRGEGLQTIDMNQDNYMEEAWKMRNLLQEFSKRNDGVRYPTVLGVREHTFTGSASSVARFMSNQEMSFVTIGQRVLADPLNVRFHYGHPDVFDRLFHLTRGGVSKASKGINLSEDIFAGFNSTLREGNITHHEYIQVGKGRDVGLNQISMFEAKVANGNGEQTISRDIYRLGHCFDFFRMLSCYFSTVGFYFSSLITVLTVYVFLLGRLYLILSGLEEGLITQPAIRDNKPLQVALASQSFYQIGFLMGLPMLMEIGLERGFRTALSEFIFMQLQLASVFFTFSLGTKIHYFGRTLLHGGAKYRPTGRGFVVFHAKFADNYRIYSRSHFVKGIELMMLLLVYQIFGQSYILINISMWFMVGTWLFAPFWFNPSGFEWRKISDDWIDWKKWISNRRGKGVQSEESWESWWEEEQEHLHYSGKCGIIVEILLSLRFFIYQYGFVYHWNITKRTKSFLVYGVSWLVIFLILFMIKTLSTCQTKFGEKLHVFRLIKGLILLTFVTILVTLIALSHMTLQEVIVCAFAFMPTGWGLLLIAQACKPVVQQAGLWGPVRALARGYEIVMSLLLFAPVAFLAWFPLVSEFQTHMLFNQACSRDLQISRIFGRQGADRSLRNRE